MIVVLIDWYIKLDKVDEFKKRWETEFTIEDQSGLIGEFLSEPADIKNKEWITWDMQADFPADLLLHCKRFVNIALWEDEASFYNAMNDKFGKKNDSPADFEYVRRRRAVLNPLTHRIGGSELPKDNPKGVS